jgi:hypothetical protein
MFDKNSIYLQPLKVQTTETGELTFSIDFLEELYHVRSAAPQMALEFEDAISTDEKVKSQGDVFLSVFLKNSKAIRLAKRDFPLFIPGQFRLDLQSRFFLLEKIVLVQKDSEFVACYSSRGDLTEAFILKEYAEITEHPDLEAIKTARPHLQLSKLDPEKKAIIGRIKTFRKPALLTPAVVDNFLGQLLKSVEARQLPIRFSLIDVLDLLTKRLNGSTIVHEHTLVSAALKEKLEADFWITRYQTWTFLLDKSGWLRYVSYRGPRIQSTKKVKVVKKQASPKKNTI